jgi:hypothetical protein
MTNQSVPEQLLQISVNRLVSENLGGLVRKFADFTKNMEPVARKEAGLLVLGMVETACGDFITKMRARAESTKSV